MTDKQPEARRLADRIDKLGFGECLESAAELRRLHEVNAELVEALRKIKHHFDTDEYAWEIASAAIAKATGEQQ